MEQDATANRLARAIGDMQEAQHYLMVLWKLKSGELDIKDDFIMKSVREAAFVAAVIAYSRPFKKSNSDGKADRSISLSDLPLVGGDPQLTSLHKTIIEKRDRAVAHADWEYHPTELLGIEGGMTVRHSPRPVYTEGIKLEAFQKLSELVCKECMERAYSRDLKNAQAKDS